MKPELKQTDNYRIFELHRHNRDIKNIAPLVSSMKKYGFLPHKSISCVKNGNGKLIVTDGHHRLAAAESLGIPVWYTLADKSEMTIQEEQRTVRPWNLSDYLASYCRNGIPAYAAVKRYVDETGIALQDAISLLGGESAGSHNKVGQFKCGTYTLGDQTRANAVKSIVFHMKNCGIALASNSYFVQALSRMLWIEEFSIRRFKEKVSSHAALFEKQPNMGGYMEEIEKIYNRKSKDKVPLVFIAEEKSRKRQESFGKKH